MSSSQALPAQINWPTDTKQHLHRLSVSLIVLGRLILFSQCVLLLLNSRIDMVFIKQGSFSSSCSCLTCEWGKERTVGEFTDVPLITLRMSDKWGQKIFRAIFRRWYKMNRSLHHPWSLPKIHFNYRKKTLFPPLKMLMCSVCLLFLFPSFHFCLILSFLFVLLFLPDHFQYSSDRCTIYFNCGAGEH